MMRYYQTQGPTTYNTFDAPEDKSPLELRPSLEKGEDTHVRDCLTWHSKSPRHTYRGDMEDKVMDTTRGRQHGHGYNMYTHNGQDYWTSGDCGMPGCRTCGGGDHLINRDVGYLRRNELGRTIDRGFSSKPWKLRLRDGDYDSNGNWAPRYDPQSGSDTARTAMRDPFNRPVDGPQTWTPRYDYGNGDKRWEPKSGCTDCKTGGGGGCYGNRCCGNKAAGGGCTPGRGGAGCCGCKDGPPSGRYNGPDYTNPGYTNGPTRGGYNPSPTVGSTDPYDLPTYRQTFPRIDEKDPGSITYRPSAPGGGYMPAPGDDGARPSQLGGGGSQSYRPPAATDYADNFQPAADTSRPMAGAGGGGAARGNDVAFPRKDDPMSSRKPTGPRRELKGQNTAVAFTV